MRSKLDNLISSLGDAFAKLQKALEKEKDEYIRDSAIQRFEFTFELTWKTLKACLEEKGIRVYSPRDAMKGAVQVGLIADDPRWLGMIRTRNLTSHVYNEAMAEGIYAALFDYVPLIRKLLEDLTRPGLDFGPGLCD